MMVDSGKKGNTGSTTAPVGTSLTGTDDTDGTLHLVTWKQIAAFAEQVGRTVQHCYLFVKGKRRTKRGDLEREFERFFGFPVESARFGGRTIPPLRRVTRRADGTPIRS